ncbi:hypothetical protein CYY_005167 [Polysphondylium violaceum]|uniref:thioredoxin-dependent peroxiredoxin n=1 Tax=Polysphondylium violaceum TaxID=133409 RepID=A0A8J4V4G7_9MYCE|nr:hypothetical protein CYY_005167 [Polysphondylium violaceum]
MGSSINQVFHTFENNDNNNIFIFFSIFLFVIAIYFLRSDSDNYYISEEDNEPTIVTTANLNSFKKKSFASTTTVTTFRKTIPTSISNTHKLLIHNNNNNNNNINNNIFNSQNFNNDNNKMKLKVGDQAPDFTAPDKDGKEVSLKQFAGKILVLYFYPKDNTPGCTAQACEFRDKYEQFIKAGADVVGVSGDDGESHTKFTSKYKLPFTLITDKSGALAKEYGVGKELLILPGRTTFIIDQNQKVASIYSSLMRATSHIEESLKVIDQLKSNQPTATPTEQPAATN